MSIRSRTSWWRTLAPGSRTRYGVITTICESAETAPPRGTGSVLVPASPEAPPRLRTDPGPTLAAEIRMARESGEWRAAFESRLPRTCTIRRRSARIRGSSGGRSISMGCRPAPLGNLWLGLVDQSGQGSGLGIHP